MNRNIYNLFIEWFFLPIGDIILNTSLIKRLRFWRQISRLTEKELEFIQRNKLKVVLEYAVSKTIYYSSFKKETNDDVFKWLNSFPILTKDILKNRGEELLSVDKNNLIEYASSGSSGIQSKIYLSKSEESNIRSILIHWWEWAGYKPGNTFLQTGMTPQRGFVKRVKDFFLRTKYYVAFGLEESKVKTALNELRIRPKSHFGGYASSLYLFAKTANSNGINNITFKSVISWGDKMFPHYRKLIENTFNTKVYDSYACNEGLMIAAQYDLDYYYIMSPHIYLEILDEKGNEVKDGEMGRVVITSLDHFSMPLIRYANGDLAVKLPKEKYPLKRKLNYPILERIIGRDTDIIYTPSGKVMIVHFFTGIFEFYPQVKQFRVIQYSKSKIVIEIIPEMNFSDEVLEEIHQDIEKKLGEEISIEYILVDRIPNTSSGKPQIIENKIVENAR